MRTVVLLSVFGATSLLFFANTAKANRCNQQVTLTFSNPVEIPGHTLANGPRSGTRSSRSPCEGSRSAFH